MSYYKLIRQHPEGKAVVGKLYAVHYYFNKRSGKYVERLSLVCATMENEAYLIPALCYKVTVTQSQKFKRLLPILNQVPGRTGIRIHRGSRPEHSKGCILVEAKNEEKLTALWLKEQNDHEECRIEICEWNAGLEEGPGWNHFEDHHVGFVPRGETQEVMFKV